MHSRNRPPRSALRASDFARLLRRGRNAPLIEQSLALRRELARLHGYATVADTQLSPRRPKRRRRGRRAPARDASRMRRPEAAELLPSPLRASRRRAAAVGHRVLGQSSARDLYDYSDEELSATSFPPRVEASSASPGLFVITITPATARRRVQPHVRFFASPTRRHPAGSFPRPYSRPETKSGGAWMNELPHPRAARRRSVKLPMAC
jgi:oligopeptidase A